MEEIKNFINELIDEIAKYEERITGEWGGDPKADEKYISSLRERAKSVLKRSDG